MREVTPSLETAGLMYTRADATERSRAGLARLEKGRIVPVVMMAVFLTTMAPVQAPRPSPPKMPELAGVYAAPDARCADAKGGGRARLRRQAPQYGLDPNRWFRNIERIVASNVGREPVRYVGNIYKYYLAYRRLRELQREPGRE